MSNNEDPIAASIVMTVILLVIVIAFIATGAAEGCRVGADNEREAWQKDAIKRGYAEYDASTGNWQWKQEQSRDEARELAELLK